MGAIKDINDLLAFIASEMNTTYKRGRLDDMNPTVLKGITYPLIWCFPFTNSGGFTDNELLFKTVQVSLAFIQISETNLDRTPDTDLVRVTDMEDLADEFIVRFNQAQTFGKIENVSGEEFPLDNRYTHVVSTYTISFNINILIGGCYD